jgi:acetyl/propionyl-CoA carboxylase alpha subunit
MTMIRKILIANRGEIACRIVRTCREMGIATVAVYSDPDAHALHVELADEAVHIGAGPAAESYLDGQKIIEAARRTNADAIHPGYGFLAENAGFAQAVIDAGIVFIGPSPRSIAAMSNKRVSKFLLKGIPVVPGYSGDDQSGERLIAAASDIGFPIMIKASAGGGGKGMRQVDSPADLPAALEAARREALQAFGESTLILEKVVVNARHIEVQIFGDLHGNVVALGERECTIQRRHQKIIEETPSPALTPDLRKRMFATAVKIGKQLGYYSAGTVEFLVDGDRNYYFMEMNTRLQVEHPVTEETTGVDLVRWQIMVAEGHALPDMDVYPAGHAIEVRIYAEDPANEFLPVTGPILRWREAPEVRLDSGVRTGDQVSVYYDPMLAKVIAYGDHRGGAIRRLEHALARLQLLGLRNNIAFLRRVLMHPDHLAGRITTRFIDEHAELLVEDATLPPAVLVAAALAKTLEITGVETRRTAPLRTYWRNNPYRPIRHRFRCDDVEHEVLLTPHRAQIYTAQVGDNRHHVQLWSLAHGDMTISIDDHRQQITALDDADDRWWVHTLDGTYTLRWLSPLPETGRSKAAEGSLRAPMPGQVIAVMVEVGQQVQRDDTLLILEAMKMEHRIKAPYDGQVTAIQFQLGQSVQADAVLLELHALENP